MPSRSACAALEVDTREYFVVAAAEGTMPAFFTVFVTLKLCPGGAAAGGSVIAVTTRSGKGSTVIFSALFRQLLFSLASRICAGPSAHA